MLTVRYLAALDNNHRKQSKGMFSKSRSAAMCKKRKKTRKRVMAPLEKLPKEEIIGLAEKYGRLDR